MSTHTAKHKKGRVILLLLGTALLVILGIKAYSYIKEEIDFYRNETQSERIFRQNVRPWVMGLKNVLKNDMDIDMNLYVNMWDDLTEEQQKEFIVSLNYYHPRIYALDNLNGVIPIVWPEERNYLNGVLKPSAFGNMVLDWSGEAKQILEVYICPNCHGTAKAIDPRWDCTVCEGLGTVCISAGRYDPDSGWQSISVPCNKCPLSTCRVCDGTGYCASEFDRKEGNIR